MPLGSEIAASGTDATYSRVADLPLQIEQCELLPLARDTSSGFTKVSTVVRLTGAGHEGQGEDITWDQVDQIEQFRGAGDLSWLRGKRTLNEFSTLLGLADLFPVEPIRDSARFYRRWAFESAALDLALRQNGLSLQDAVGRVVKPVTFVVSIRLDELAGLAPLRAMRSMDPGLHFKLDPTANWDDGLLAELASLACVDVVDMKGYYRNATVAMEADPDLYRHVFERLPTAWIEDPAVGDDTIGLLDQHRDRITWDEPIHSVADIEALPWPPRMLNLKPARFGSIRRLFETYDYCIAHGIGAYGGGMFEQGPGRGQLQYLASLFHPAGPNDLAPVEYNLQLPAGELPRSPLPRSHTRPASAGGATTAGRACDRECAGSARLCSATDEFRRARQSSGASGKCPSDQGAADEQARTTRQKERRLMQFFLTVPHDSAEEPTMASMDPAELEATLAAVEEFNTDLQKSGAFRFAGGLHPPSSAKTVDASSGEPVIVDGPFVEAPEYVGGFWVIEAEGQDAAVRWATQASKALGGRIEVRAFQDPQDA